MQMQVKSVVLECTHVTADPPQPRILVSDWCDSEATTDLRTYINASVRDKGASTV